MRIHISTESGWILRRCAEELRGQIRNHEVSVSGSRRDDVDLNYYMPYWRLPNKGEGGEPTLAAGFFTHSDERMREYAPRFDLHFTMNQANAGLLTREGASDVYVIYPGTWSPPERPPVFGVVGRTYGQGRKGISLVEKVVEAGYDVTSCGPGPWPCESFSRSISNLDAFFVLIDYLLVTSIVEGGPMPVVDAIAARVPVIAPDVGWCWEFPVIQYELGDARSLLSVLDRLTNPPTWDQWASGHQVVFDAMAQREAA